MGFLGITADVTGFSLDPPILIFAFLAATFIQVMKNEADKTNAKLEDEKKSKH